MPLLGPAALLLSFDVEADAVVDHDRWHTQEHLPERLAIPGFLRGTRWVTADGPPRYLVLYEVAGLAVLESGEYLARLNAPTPWTQRVMPRYRGMRRGLCTVLASLGTGMGGCAAPLFFSAADDSLRRWLLDQALPTLLDRPGVVAAHLLQAVQVPSMTAEQRIRGADRALDLALMLTGYDEIALAEAAAALCTPDGLARQGVLPESPGVYRLASGLSADERRSAPAAD